MGQSNRYLLDELFKKLSITFGDKPRRHELLADHTTARLGGLADIWLPVTTLDELVDAVRLARQERVPLFMLGSGANLLIQDGGVRGLVIENRTRQVWLRPSLETARDEDDRRILMAESGVILPNLARRCARLGLSGLEWAVGVPGTIGGAITNNAGAYERDMAATLVRAELLSPQGQRVWHSVDWFEYGYRTSRLKQAFEQRPAERIKWVVLQAELAMEQASSDKIKAQMNVFNERRKNSQPPGATMGSMFKNPPGDYAGRLIEAAGLKGYQVGQAQISPIHGNFFQNLGGAKATDMLALIGIVQEHVKRKFGVQLELEIEVIGESA